MQTTEKKVIIFIVEGPSDESAIGTIVKEYFSASEVRFHLAHGDVTTKTGADGDTILKRINNCVEEVKKRYRYTNQNILRIIHLADMDGVYINEDRIIENEAGPALYFTDHIETPCVECIDRRNDRKSELLYKLSATGKINGIPYRIYYMSCNLEHVLYNELREFTDEEKWEYSDAFAEKYMGKVDEFISFISNPAFAVEGSFKDTWKFIRQDTNSLNRYTNFQQLF